MNHIGQEDILARQLNCHELKQNMILKNNQIFVSPHISLKPYIAHYTFTYPATIDISDYLTLIPDVSGCLVFSFDGNDLETYYFGPSTKIIAVKNQVSTVPLMIFVEFLPCGANQLFGIHLSELADQRMPIDDISTTLKNTMTDIIFRYIDEPEYIGSMTDALNSLFLSYLTKSKSAGTVSNIVTYLYHHKDITSVRQLSEVSLYSERHFNRLFSSAIGTNAKSFLQLLRVNQAVKKLKNESVTLTALAQEIGYYDQSHFIHDFKTICGVTPGEYRLRMSDFYNEDFKF